MIFTPPRRTASIVQLGNRLCMFDGINANFVDDGDGRGPRQLGIPAPASAPTAGSPSAGNVSEGVHAVYVKFVYAINGIIYVESDPSPALSLTAAAGGNQWTLTIPTSTHLRVTGRNIYMTRAGGDAPVRVTTAQQTVADNTTTTYVLNIADASLSALGMSTNNTPLPSACYAVSYGNRLIVGGGVRWTGYVTFTNGSAAFTLLSGAFPITLGDVGKWFVLSDNSAYTVATVTESTQAGTLTTTFQGTTGTYVVTVVQDPNMVTIGNILPDNIEGYDPEGDAQFYVGQDDGMDLRAIALYHQTLLFGKQRAIYQLAGELITTPSDTPSYSVQLLTNKVGIASHFSVSNLLGGGVIFYGGDGIYYLDGFQPRKISQLLDPLFDENRTDAITLGGVEDCRVDHSLDEQAHGVFDPITQRYFLWLARKANSSTRSATPIDMCVMLDFKKKNSRNQPAAWVFLIPAATSRGFYSEPARTFRILIGNYHGQVHELFGGRRDGLSSTISSTANWIYKVTQVTAPTGSAKTVLTLSSTAPYTGWSDPTTGTGGLPIVGVSGSRKGRFGVLRSCPAANQVEFDDDLYGTCPFQVNDIVTIGGMFAYWASGYDTMGAQGMVKRGSRLKVSYKQTTPTGSATLTPALYVSSRSEVSGVTTTVTSAQLTATTVPSQQLDLPQRADYFQTVLDSVGADFIWKVSEMILSSKPRGFR